MIPCAPGPGARPRGPVTGPSGPSCAADVVGSSGSTPSPCGGSDSKELDASMSTGAAWTSSRSPRGRTGACEGVLRVGAAHGPDHVDSAERRTADRRLSPAARGASCPGCPGCQWFRGGPSDQAAMVSSGSLVPRAPCSCGCWKRRRTTPTKVTVAANNTTMNGISSWCAETSCGSSTGRRGAAHLVVWDPEYASGLQAARVAACCSPDGPMAPVGARSAQYPVGGRAREEMTHGRRA